MDLRSKTRTYAFILVSIITHIAVAAGVMFYKVRTETKQTQISTVEINDSQADASTAPLQSESEMPASAPKLANSFAAPQTAKAASELPAKIEKNSPIPEEDSSTLESNPVAVQLKDDEISEVLDQVDEEVRAQINEAQKQMAEDNDEALKEQEAKLEALRLQQAEEEATRAAAAEKRKRENERQALAAVAAERIAQEAQAARQAEQARQTEAARIAKEEHLGMNTGGSLPVRSLSELRPMPGNRRPIYDIEHRRRGLQGEVAFLAYVSKEGLLTEFKMLQSSGHRELDAKTLKTIKSWRFYPGQEGWVEIPFKWDLSGEPQELPATLRRRVQVSETSSKSG